MEQTRALDPSTGSEERGTDRETLLSDASAGAAELRGVRRLRTAGLLAAGLLGAMVLALAFSGPAETAHGQVSYLEMKATKKEAKKCSGVLPGESCINTTCCTYPGTQCFTKVAEEWAICRPSCHPGPDPTDINSQTWECKALGPKKEGHYNPPKPPVASPWVVKECAGFRANCSSSRCCKEQGNACYRKNDHWAGCKPFCNPGPDPADENPHPWECKQLGMRTPGWPKMPPVAAKWVAENCSKGDEDCSKTMCCAEAGMQCYVKNGHKAKCLMGCLPGVHMDDENDHPWNCTEIGSRTPGLVNPHPPKIAPWVKRECSAKDTVDCTESRCCKDEGMQCFMADSNFSACLPSCTKWLKWSVNGKLINSKTKKPWTCKKLGPRTPRTWGKPSLFCFSVFRLYNEEANLMRNQLFKGIGIFACDNYAVFSADANSDLGEGPLGPLKTVHFQNVGVGVSKDGTAANTGLFMNVWEAVRWDGRYATADWTIKADPDAVVIPFRLRNHLRPHSYHSAFILNCGKAGMPDGPMMFGSLEAITRMALQSYFNSESTCRSLPWGAWGEDLWLGNCLKMLGASAEGDFGMVSDGVCLYNNCGDMNAAAFHPLKNVHAWLACYWGATR